MLRENRPRWWPGMVAGERRRPAASKRMGSVVPPSLTPTAYIAPSWHRMRKRSQRAVVNARRAGCRVVRSLPWGTRPLTPTLSMPSRQRAGRREPSPTSDSSASSPIGWLRRCWPSPFASDHARPPSRTVPAQQGPTLPGRSAHHRGDHRGHALRRRGRSPAPFRAPSASPCSRDGRHRRRCLRAPLCADRPQSSGRELV